MLVRVLESLERAILEHPRTIVLAAIVATALALALGAGLELRTSRREIAPADDPNQLRYDALRAQFTGAAPLIVGLEGDAPDIDTARLEAAADGVAEALRRLPSVDRVDHRVDPEWLLRRAPWLTPPDQLRAAARQFPALLGNPDGEIVLGGFEGLNERLASRMEQALAAGATLPGDAAATDVERLATLLRGQRQFYEDPAGFVRRMRTPLALVDEGRRGATTDAGYLATREGDLLFLFVSPTDTTNDVRTLRGWIAAVRDAATAALERHPGITFALTGQPALTVEEMETIGRDTRLTSLIAIVGVALLAAMTFHRRRHAALGLVVLAMGVAWALGAVRLELGYLNLITTALVPILIGIGIDYAVHPLSQLELELAALGDRRRAVRAAFRKTGSALIVSAVTTAAAFFCFLLMDFRGFAELGLVAGTGVLLCLAAALVVLPALMVLFAAGMRSPSQGRPGAPADADGGGDSGGDAGSGGAGATLDRLWNPPVAAALCGRPRLVIAIALTTTIAALVVGLGVVGPGVPMRSSLLDLLPARAESLRLLQRVGETPGLEAYFNVVVASDVDELRRMRERAAAQPAIAAFDSALDLLPADGDATAAAMPELAATLARTRVESDPGATDAATLADSLERLVAALDSATEAAFLTGSALLVGPLEDSRQEAAAALQLVRDADPDTTATWGGAQRDLLTEIDRWLTALRVGADDPPPTLASLPDGLRARFTTRDGRPLGFLYPAGSVFSPADLQAFNSASRTVASDATGFPVLFEIMSARITSGFALALSVGALVAFAILAVDLRNPLLALLALVPVGVGIAWLLGLMSALGLAFNFANLVAVPLVIGVGIDNGVHLLHRCRQERGDGVIGALADTGRAMIIASATTMVGFGSLALATHRGMASLGTLLFLGVGACLVASLVVLPCLIVALGVRPR